MSQIHQAGRVRRMREVGPGPRARWPGHMVTLKNCEDSLLTRWHGYCSCPAHANGHKHHDDEQDSNEQVFENESRILIPSPAVTTYDLCPEMSAPDLTKTIVEAIHKETYDVIICNYANADMVGHTGNFAATVQAIECLDKAMHDTWQALQKVGGQLLITADHGNAESMFDDNTHQAHTAHTNQPVPFLYIGENWHFNQITGSLIDIAPTLLTLLGIHPPKEMTGKTLLVEDHATH